MRVLGQRFNRSQSVHTLYYAVNIQHNTVDGSTPRSLQHSVNSAQSTVHNFNAVSLRSLVRKIASHRNFPFFNSRSHWGQTTKNNKTLPLNQPSSVFPTLGDQSDVVVRDRPTAADTFFCSLANVNTFPTLISRWGIGPNRNNFNTQCRGVARCRATAGSRCCCFFFVDL